MCRSGIMVLEVHTTIVSEAYFPARRYGRAISHVELWCVAVAIFARGISHVVGCQIPRKETTYTGVSSTRMGEDVLPENGRLCAG